MVGATLKRPFSGGEGHAVLFPDDLVGGHRGLGTDQAGDAGEAVLVDRADDRADVGQLVGALVAGDGGDDLGGRHAPGAVPDPVHGVAEGEDAVPIAPGQGAGPGDGDGAVHQDGGDGAAGLQLDSGEPGRAGPRRPPRRGRGRLRRSPGSLGRNPNALRSAPAAAPGQAGDGERQPQGLEGRASAAAEESGAEWGATAANGPAKAAAAPVANAEAGLAFAAAATPSMSAMGVKPQCPSFSKVARRAGGEPRPASRRCRAGCRSCRGPSRPGSSWDRPACR